MEGLKNWVTLKELKDVMPGNFSKRYLYYLVQSKQIPHYKPSPNKLLFNLADVEQWLMTTRVELEMDDDNSAT